MRHRLLLLPLILAGCTGHPRPYAPVENVYYAAIGQEPFWMLAIGDDSIVLTFGPDPGARRGDLDSHRYPRTLPRTVGGVRTWESGNDTAAITVQAIEESCQGSRGRVYRDHVRVRLDGRELHGCGGPQIGEQRG